VHHARLTVLFDPALSGLLNVADGRGELAAGMDFAVRQQCHEVERGATAHPRAPGIERPAEMVPDNVEEIVLHPKDRIVPARRQVFPQK
jgi:hypothetical protein